MKEVNFRFIRANESIYLRKEDISELINVHKIDNQIRVIESVHDNGILGIR